jgi:hypothetical protein
LQLDLKSKANRFELEDMNMQKCNRTDLNAVAEKINSLQHEVTSITLLLNESLKLNLTKDPKSKKKSLEIMN